MLPEPLHPAVVHFPIVLMILLPLFALGALWAIRRGSRPRMAWALPLAVSAALAASALAAVRTGEAQEEKVEDVVGERALHEHEEAAERFQILAGVLLLVAATGLAGGRVGTAGRWLTVAGSVGVALAGVQVGSSGGELVYEHGAGSAYGGVVAPTKTVAIPAPPGGGAHDEGERD
jgi:uncharacterized membrane protein